MSDPRQDIPLSIPVMGDKEREYVDECLKTGWLSTAGGYITRFEDAVREVTGAKYAVACQSGTAALHVALRCVGVRAGDEVIVPTLTFIATVNPVSYVGAHPVFVDCDRYMNIDPAAVAEFLESECERRGGDVIHRATHRRVAAILPVHVFGNPCDIESLHAVAESWGLPLVEDAAESLGSSWTSGAFSGRHTGTVGVAGILSFNANKIITTGGGGMILTDDEELAAATRHLSTQAKVDPARFIHDEVGYNYRMTNVQAAIGVAQLESLPERVERKRKNHAAYAELLSDVAGIDVLGVPEGTAPNHWFYSMCIDSGEYGMDREGLMSALGARGIQTRPIWYLNHLQEPYQGEYVHGDLRQARWFWERVLNLPCTHTLEVSDMEYVCDAIRDLGGSR